MGASRHTLLQGAVLACAMAVMACFASSQLHPRFSHHQESIDAQRVLLRGEPASYEGYGKIYFAQAYSRVLFPALLEWGLRICPEDGYRVFLGLRLISAWAFFFLFFVLATRWGGCTARTAGAGMAFLALGYLCTFHHGWEIPTDFPDGFFLCAFLAAAFSRSWLVMAGLAALAACNRESAIAAGMIWFSLYGVQEGKVQWKEAAFATFLVLMVGAITVVLRNAILGPRINLDLLAVPVVGQQFLIFSIPALIRETGWYALHPNSWPALLVVMFLPSAWWLRQVKGALDNTAWRLLWCALGIFILILVFGKLTELRVYIPCLVLMVFVACRAEAQFSMRREDEDIRQR